MPPVCWRPSWLSIPAGKKTEKIRFIGVFFPTGKTAPARRLPDQGCVIERIYAGYDPALDTL